MTRGTRRKVPLWLKIAYGGFLAVLIPIYWQVYGPANFLWGSDIALLLLFVAALFENRLIASMMVVGLLPFEIVWIADLMTGAQWLGATEFFFAGPRPWPVRALTLYHLALPPVMIFLLIRLRYDPRALWAQTLFAWTVLAVTYGVTEPVDNINFVYGPGAEPQSTLPPLFYLGLWMVALPLVVHLPTHLVLKKLFPLEESRHKPHP